MSEAAPSGGSLTLSLELSPAEVERLDSWIAAQSDPRPSRAEAARRILAEALGKSTETVPPAIADAAAVPEALDGPAKLTTALPCKDGEVVSFGY